MPKAARSAERKQSGRIKKYFRETIGELRKVNWPSRKETINLTIVVLIVMAGMSALLGLLDFLFSRIFALIIG